MYKFVLVIELVFEGGYEKFIQYEIKSHNKYHVLLLLVLMNYFYFYLQHCLFVSSIV